MRIAFIDPNPVAGGIVRFSCNLAAALCKIDPGVTVTFFTAEVNYNSNKDLFTRYRGAFTTRVLKSTKKTYTGTMVSDIAIMRLLGTSRAELQKKEIYMLTKDYDAVFFTNAHAMEFIKVNPPSFATFHDLLWKYQFGMPLFSASFVTMMDDQIRKWLQKTRIIVPTPFVKSEVLRFFPDSPHDIEVVYHSNFAQKSEPSPEKDAGIIRSLGIEKEYILYPCHIMPHKNHQSLFCAFNKLMHSKEFSGRYILVLTGSGTDHFKHGKSTPLGLSLGYKYDFDTLGLGYISNFAVDAVVRNASLVISTSLYEAGSGPALDAWINEVPVIISDIEPHRDQLRHFGIECNVFDPTDPNDIKDKMAYALNNLEKLKAQSVSASAKFMEYNWEVVGREYLDIFRDKAIRQNF